MAVTRKNRKNRMNQKNKRVNRRKVGTRKRQVNKRRSVSKKRNRSNKSTARAHAILRTNFFFLLEFNVSFSILLVVCCNDVSEIVLLSISSLKNLGVTLALGLGDSPQFIFRNFVIRSTSFSGIGVSISLPSGPPSLKT